MSQFIIYTVKAKLENIVVWHFTSILAESKEEAIKETKDTMKRIMGTIPDYDWVAEPEWEYNLAVN
jgi:hypothetical protein